MSCFFRGLLFRTVPGVVAMVRLIAMTRTVMFVESLGAVRTIEFMAFTRNTGKGNGHHEQGKNFHRGAS